MRPARVLAACGAAITGLGVGYGLAMLAGWQPAWGPVAQAVLHLGALALVLALASAGVAGSGVAARAGFGLAMAGQALFMVAELVYPASPDSGDILFGVGPLLTGSGMIVVGSAVLRTRIWPGWSRLLPLAVGVWILVPVIPVLIATGGPPDPLALLTLIAWDVLWCVTGVAVLARMRGFAASISPGTARPAPAG